jgi:hypothetical protein
MPSFSVTSSCTNCDGLFADIDNLEPFGALVEVEAEYGTPLPSTVLFEDFGPNTGSADLTDGLPAELDYEFALEVFTETMTGESFTPTDNFTYFEGAFRTDQIFFTVPEPSTLGLGLTALLTLLCIRESKRKSR